MAGCGPARGREDSGVRPAADGDPPGLRPSALDRLAQARARLAAGGRRGGGGLPPGEDFNGSEARSGYVDSLEERSLEVHIPEELRRRISSPTAEALIQVLELDPRPSYQDDPQRIYGLSFAGMNIHFTVSGKLLTVLSID